MNQIENSNNTNQVKNYLNENSLNILRFISLHPGTTSNFKTLIKEQTNLSESQFYRYITTLKKHKLIQIGEKWIKKNTNFGRFYNVTSQGRQVLAILEQIANIES